MNRRFIVLGVASAAVVGAVVPSFAQPVPPVTITHSTDNGVSVGVQEGYQPIVGAQVSPDGTVCVGVSLQLPQCVPGGEIQHIGVSQPAQALPTPPVVVRHDQYGTVVGVGDVGVYVEPDGTVCPIVSTQDWRCIPPA